MNFQTLSNIIKRRRAIYPRMFSDRPISNETVMEILEMANWAPTHKKTEPWRFKIFKGEALKKLSDYLGAYYKTNTHQDKFSEAKYKRTVEKPLKSGCVIAICMFRDPEISIPEWEEIAAVACAVQNMWLSCTALGIGSYWSSPKSIVTAKEFLDLGPNERCLGLFYMGYTDIQDLPGLRKPIEDKVVWM